jgi:biotin synthase
MKLLSEAGAERIGIPLDAATKELFDKVKGFSAGGPYCWEKQFKLLSEAVNVFGKGKVSTHLIVGLGETEREMVETVQKCFDMGVLPALFAFTPISGTALAHLHQPRIQSYRRIQIARHLITHRIARCENMQSDIEERISNFGVDAQTLMQIIEAGEAFRTSGCPDCNRPYYNEKPSGPIYNYPKILEAEDFSLVQCELGLNWSLKS